MYGVIVKVTNHSDGTKQNRCQHAGIYAEYRVCLGAIKCSSYKRLICSKTNSSARIRNAQLNGRCALCSGTLSHEKCNAKTYHYTSTQEGELWSVWEHIGTHSHGHVPGGRRSTKEKVQIDEQVMRNHGATVHQLQTGNTGSVH